jgi:hypothetical protein
MPAANPLTNQAAFRTLGSVSLILFLCKFGRRMLEPKLAAVDLPLGQLHGDGMLLPLGKLCCNVLPSGK